MWWIRWGMATLAEELWELPAAPLAPPPPLAGEGLSDSGEGVPFTLRETH